MMSPKSTICRSQVPDLGHSCAATVPPLSTHGVPAILRSDQLRELLIYYPVDLISKQC